LGHAVDREQGRAAAEGLARAAELLAGRREGGKLGRNGVEQIIEIKLLESEAAELKKSADDVKLNMDKVKF
jgi:hypothetical protein